MQFIVYASGSNPARPSTKKPGTTLPASTWGLLSRYGHGPDAEAALTAVPLAKYGADRLSLLADIVRKDEKNRLIPATPPHDTDEDRGDILVDASGIFPHGIREVEEPVLDGEGAPVLDGAGKPVTQTVRELRLRILVA